MRVMSMRRRIFSSGGSLTLKEELPLNVTTFFMPGRSYTPFIRGQESSMLTLTGSKVSTFDWKIRKSDASMLDTMDGLYSFTQMWFFSEEYSMKYSISQRGRLLSTSFLQWVRQAMGFPACMLASTSSKAYFSRSRMVQLNLTLQDCSFSVLGWISKQFFSLMVLKNWLMLCSISRSFPRSTSCSHLPRVFSLLYSITRLSSLTLAVRNWEKRAYSHLMKSSMEQFLMRQKAECSQKTVACSRARKKMGSCSRKYSLAASAANCRKKVSMAISSSCSGAGRSFSSFRPSRYSPSISCRQFSSETRLLLTYPSCSSPSCSSYHTTTEKRRSEFLSTVSSTRTLLGAMTGAAWKLRQAQWKQTSSTISCSMPSLFSLLFPRSLQNSSSVRRLLRPTSDLAFAYRTHVRNSQLFSTAVASFANASTLSSVSIKNNKKKSPQPGIERGSPA